MRSWICFIALTLTFAGEACGARLSVPQPPRQRIPWHAPSSVPTKLLSAVETLFDQGFPDPRGCEYREIEVEVSGVWGMKTSLVQTRGWVLPERSGVAQRFAICWNGVVYPVAKAGPGADLRAEAMNLSASPAWRFGNAVGETMSVFSTNALSTRVLLLLRCGETEVALENWKPDERLASEMRARGRRSDATNTGADGYDPYLQLAGDWAWELFDATISAHMRGNWAFALATARQLANAQPKIEAEAAKRGFPHPHWNDSAKHEKERPYLLFLEQLPQLLADLERRAREGKRVSVIQSGLTNIADQGQRIATLVRDLDLVQARQWSQPGGVNLAEDSVVSALIQEGDPAVDPLLDCLETDKRLTRSVGFGRDFFSDRHVIPVASAARTALLSVLQANFGSAAEMRTYWERYKGLKLEERWYAILKDDAAGRGRWLEAAANLAQRENIRAYPGGFSVESPAPANAPVKLRGEVLRAKSGPSVSELLARRAVEVVVTNLAGYDLSTACEIGLRLAAWDPPGSVPVAKTLVERCRAVLEYSNQKNSWKLGRVGAFLAKLTTVRANGGDPLAFDDYTAWLTTATPAQLEHSTAECLEPFVRFPTNQVLQTSAESLFGDANSAWGKLPWKVSGLYRPEESELVKVPAFRRLLSRELERKEVCGSIEWRAPGTAGFQITNYMSGSRGLVLAESERPAPGTKGELRWCDWIAWSLFNAKQIPSFNPFAPIERREDAIKSAKILLDRP